MGNLAGDVGSCSGLARASDDHFVQIGAGHAAAVQRGAGGGRTQLGRGEPCQRSAEPADGRSHAGGDHDVSIIVRGGRGGSHQAGKGITAGGFGSS
jgi:hypothetical protein